MALSINNNNNNSSNSNNKKYDKKKNQPSSPTSTMDGTSTSTPRGTSSTRTKSATTRAANHRRFMKGVGLGFALGVAASFMFAMIRESDAHLKHLSLINDMAAGAMPFLSTSCGDQTKDVSGSASAGGARNTTAAVATTTTTTTVTTSPQIKKENERPKKPPMIIVGKDPKENDKDNAVARKKEDDENDHLDGIPIADPNVQDFDPNQRVVMVTKIHGPGNLQILEQAICLLTQAYNKRVNYDIIVFSSDPVPDDDATKLKIQQIAAPANIYFITDNPGLHTMVNAMSPERRAHLLNRCNVTDTSELTWYTQCVEQSSTQRLVERIAYTWQAEFRAKHLWVHPSMMKYKYMLWFDVDLFCSKVWQQDPISIMKRYDLVLLFDHFPQGMAKGTELPYRIRDGFDGRVFCEIIMVNGTLFPKQGKCIGKEGRLRQVHGFFHVTDLDFYRSPPVLKWHDVLIGDSKFSRQFDDQIGVTMPGAILAGNRSWDMRYHGIKLDVIHNYLYDGRHERRAGGFISWWNENGEQQFPEAYKVCTNINAAG